MDRTSGAGCGIIKYHSHILAVIINYMLSRVRVLGGGDSQLSNSSANYLYIYPKEPDDICGHIPGMEC